MSYHWIESKSLNLIQPEIVDNQMSAPYAFMKWLQFSNILFYFIFTGESMNVPEIYGLRNSLSESSSSISNSSMNGSCVGTFAVTPTSSPDDSPLQLNAIPFSQISTMSSLNNAMSTPVKGFNSLQVSFCSIFPYRVIRKATRSKQIWLWCSFATSNANCRFFDAHQFWKIFVAYIFSILNIPINTPKEGYLHQRNLSQPLLCIVAHQTGVCVTYIILLLLGDTEHKKTTHSS